jgi:hypothetical protein
MKRSAASSPGVRARVNEHLDKHGENVTLPRVLCQAPASGARTKIGNPSDIKGIVKRSFGSLHDPFGLSRNVRTALTKDFYDDIFIHVQDQIRP